MELPTLPYQVIVPVVFGAALAAAGVLADADVRPLRAAHRALTAAREHAARAAVSVALAVACAAAPAGTAVTR